MQHYGTNCETRFPTEVNNEQVSTAPKFVWVSSSSTNAHSFDSVGLYLLTHNPIKFEKVQPCHIVLTIRKGDLNFPFSLSIISMQLQQTEANYKGCHRVRINNQCDGAFT